MISKNKQYKDRYYAKHKLEIAERNRLRDLKYPEKVKLRKRKHHLKLYGLTIEQYNRIYDEQDGKCAICDIAFEDFNIDHDHNTGKVRGLLCRFCNLGIGNLRDNLDLVRRAVEYLEKHQCV